MQDAVALEFAKMHAESLRYVSYRAARRPAADAGGVRFETTTFPRHVFGGRSIEVGIRRTRFQTFRKSPHKNAPLYHIIRTDLYGILRHVYRVELKVSC
jgi:hypothetical protein